MTITEIKTMAAALVVAMDDLTFDLAVERHYDLMGHCIEPDDPCPDLDNANAALELLRLANEFISKIG